MVRQAKPEDMKFIAQVHAKCFPKSFSTVLGYTGGDLLTRYYQEYMSKAPELFFVAENESNDIIGFCMGYYMEENNFQSDFLKHNLVRIIMRFLVLLVSGNKIAWKKFFSFLRKNESDVKVIRSELDDIPLTKKGDLLSICVLPDCRGSGVANQLIHEYERALFDNGRSVCMLSVESDNARGIRFYEKNGYMVYKKYGESYQYGKVL